MCANAVVWGVVCVCVCAGHAALCKNYFHHRPPACRHTPFGIVVHIFQYIYRVIGSIHTCFTPRVPADHSASLYTFAHGSGTGCNVLLLGGKVSMHGVFFETNMSKCCAVIEN